MSPPYDRNPDPNVVFAVHVPRGCEGGCLAGRRSCSNRASTRGLDADALALRIEQRLGCDLALDPRSEDLDLDRSADRGATARDVRVGNRPLDRVAVPAARDAPDDRAIGAHRLGTEGDRQGIVEHEADQATGRLPAVRERRGADEVALVELDGKAEACLVWCVVRSDVAAPHAVALLEP